MRIFISADMEGVTGVAHRDQLVPEGRTYERARKLMTADVNAVITGALREAPAAEFIVNDSHGVMRNILIEDLHESAQLVVGPASFANKPLCMSQGIQAGADVAFFTGYHSRAGTPGGLLAHTWSGGAITNIRINGEIIGETALNAAVVGHYDVPVGLVSGAHELEPEARATIPDGFVFVSLKQSFGFTAALCLPPARTKKLLEDGAADAIRRHKAGKLKPHKPTLPITISVEFHRREMAAKAAETPGTERTDERTVAAKASTALEAAETAWKAVCRAMEEDPAWLK
jgi:D-amino peptidase